MLSKELSLLLIEDSADDAELILAELAQWGCLISHRRVEDAAEMALALDSRSWDAVISDDNLPSFSALAALELLKSKRIDLPFILVSGFVGEETAAALMRAGAHDFITKGNLSRLVPALTRELREVATRRERRHALQRLKSSEKFLRDITSSLGEGILVQDRRGKLLFMNPLAEIMLGWPERELMERNIHQTIHCHNGESRDESECPYSNIQNFGGFYKSYDEHFVRRDGHVFPVSIVATTIAENGEWVATVTAFQDITDRKQMEDELNESRIQLRNLSVFLQTVREEEQKRIARELHDEMGQALTALRIDLDWLGQRISQDDSRLQEKLGAMLRLLEKTVDSMRRIAEDLRPGLLDDLGLAAAVEWHTEQFQNRTGIRCNLSMNRDEFALHDRIATAVFRVVQEALTNVARHSGASEVRVGLDESNGCLCLEVHDNGAGFDSERRDSQRSHYGILGMKERINPLGGQLDIVSAPGNGSLIRAVIPLPAGASQ